MKGHLKRAAAILGIVVLLAAFCMPMVFALIDTGDGGAFRASLAAAILVPVLGYVFWMVYRLLHHGERETDSKMKNIIFDVGRVLVDFDWEGYLSSFGFPQEEYEAIAEKVFLSQEWNERDRGLYPEEKYVQNFMDALPMYAQDVKRVMEKSGQTIHRRDYAYTWTKYLKSQGYHLYILSNYCSCILEQTKPDMTFLENMDGAVFSCDVRQIKPEKPIYETLLNRYGLVPEESVFLDDKEENCETARSLGIHAICFHDLRQAAAELEKLGIK